MAKEKSKKQNMWPYLAIVGIVAIVAAIVLVMNLGIQTPNVSLDNKLVLDSENYLNTVEGETDDLISISKPTDNSNNFAGNAATSTYTRGKYKTFCLDLEPINDPYLTGALNLFHYTKSGSKWKFTDSELVYDSCETYADPSTGEYKLSPLLTKSTCNNLDGTFDNPFQAKFYICTNGCKQGVSSGKLTGRCKSGGYSVISEREYWSIYEEYGSGSRSS